IRDIFNLQLIKGLVIMKLIVLLVLLSLFQVQASSYAQTVSLSEKNVSIINIFKKIKAQTNYNLICKSEIVKKFPPLSIELKGAPLKDALDQLLDPHGFSYV